MKDARGDVAVRRQGPEPAQPGPQLLAEAGARRRGPPDPRGHRSRRRRRDTRGRLGQRGAAPRGQPHQAVQAALQRPAQGRQELPVHQDHAGRRLPADRADAQARQRRQPLLRAVRVGIERRRVDEPRPPALPVPDLHDRDQGRRARAPAAVPAVPHQALPGPVHRGHLEGRLPGRHRAGRAVPRGPPGDARQGAREARWRRPPTDSSSSGRRRCATRSGPSSGRWRARRWRRSRGPSSTSSAWPARTTRPPSSCSRSATASSIGRDVYLLDAAARGDRRRGPRSFLEQYYARATSIPREVLVPGRCPEAADLEAFLAERRGGPVHLRVPQRGEKRELMALAHPERRGDAGARAGPLAGRPGQDAGRARGAGRGARTGRAAAAHRVLRHQQLPGQRVGRQHGRVRGRQAARRASTGGSGSGRSQGPNDFASHQEVLRRRFRVPRTGDEGAEEERRWAMPDLVIVDGGKGQVSAAKEVLDEIGLHDLPLAGLAKEREELFLPGPSRADRAAGDVAGPVPRPAPARRGAPVRHHLPPRPARQAHGPVGVRRPARRRPEAPRGAAARCSVRSSGSARRRSSRSPRCPGIGAALAARIKATLEARRSQRPRHRVPARPRPRAELRAWYHPASMRRAGPYLIVIIGVGASDPRTSGRASSCPTSADPDGGAWRRRNEARPRPRGRPPGRVPGPAQGRPDADGR